MLETNKIYLRIILVACLATTVTASWWDDFTNNLATDLTPLIALFGEQATKQFLSESTTILDNFIFAMAPLGILTGVVSAIRVCGGPSLRAFIGRAQEGGGIAEAELCSSTSRDVCELYHNGAIVRVFGRPKILEIVYDPVLEANEAGENKHKFGISISREYFQQSILNDKRWQEKGLDDSDDESKNSLSSATNSSNDFAPNPNLSLNIGIVKRSSYVYLTAAIFGFLAQSSVIVLAAVVKYKLKWKKDENLIDPWAFPFVLMGTISICFGMFLCATLVNDSTKERVFEQKVKANGRDALPGPMLYVVQPGNQVVGDQTFDPFLFSKITHSYMTSWKAPSASDPSSGPPVPTGRKRAFGFKDLPRPSEEASVLIATLITTLGFALQFVGLRAMHSIVSLLQLAITILMSVIRTLLRTQRLSTEANVLRDRPDEVSSHELDWLALQIGRRADEPRCFWTVVPEVLTQDPEVPPTANHNKAWEYRFRLAELTGQSANAKMKLSNAWGNDLVSGRLQAQQLKKAIEESISLFIAHAKPRDGIRGAKHVPWSLNVAVGHFCTRSHQAPTYQSINVPLREQDSHWTVDQNLLEAIIGLWSWSIISDPRTEGESFGFRTSSASDIPVYRAIAAGTQIEREQAWKEIQFWIGSPNLTLSPLVKGMQSSAYPRTNATTIWCRGNPIEDDDSHPVPNLGVSGLYQRLFGWHGMSTSRGSTIGGIRIESNHIPTLCAQDIYQSFICNIVAYFDLDIDTTTVTMEKNYMRLEHQLVTKLMECFEASGLGSKHDASLVIIPALQNNSTLPRSVKAIPAACLTARELRKGHKFQEAEWVLRWAWGVVSELGEFQETALIELGELYRHALFSEGWQNFGKLGVDWMDSQRSPSLSHLSSKAIDRYVSLEKRPREIRTGRHVLDAILRREREETLWSISQLEKGSDLPVDKQSGRTALSLLSQEGWFELVRALLEIGSIVDSVDYQGRTPLSYAAEHGHVPVISMLMEESALPTTEDSFRRTPLSHAAGGGHVSVIEKLLSDPRVSIYSKDKQNRSPLHWAATSGHHDAIRYLVGQGARVDDADDNEQTPLLAALLNNRRRKTDRKRTADLLVGLKSKVDFLTQKDGVLDSALTNGEFTCAEYLLENNDGQTRGIVVDFRADPEDDSPFPTFDFRFGFRVRFFDEDNEEHDPTMRDILEIAKGGCYMAITCIELNSPSRSVTCQRQFNILSTLLDDPHEVGTIEDWIEAAAWNDDGGLELISMLCEPCETQSQTRIQITDEAIKAIANNRRGKHIMILLLTQREKDIHITEATVSAIAKYFDGDVMTLLLNRHGARSLITVDSVIAAAANRKAGREVMALLLDQGGAQVLITEETIKLAAANMYGRELMEILLDRGGDQVQITEDVLKAAAASFYGIEIFKLLLDKRGDQVQITEEVLKAAAASFYALEIFGLLLDRRGDQVQITEEVLTAAAAGDGSLKIFELLLDGRGDQVQITEEVLKAAAASRRGADVRVKLILDRLGDEFQITEEMVKVAAGNADATCELMELLLDRLGDEFQITEEIVKVAAGNTYKAHELMELLLDRQGSHVQTTEEVVIIVAGNENEAASTLRLLLERRGCEVQITEEVLKAAVGTGVGPHETLEVILDSRGDQVYVTENLVKAIVANEKFGRRLMKQLLDRREEGFQVTDEVMKLLPAEWKYARRKMMEILQKEKREG